MLGMLIILNSHELCLDCTSQDRRLSYHYFWHAL